MTSTSLPSLQSNFRKIYQLFWALLFGVAVAGTTGRDGGGIAVISAFVISSSSQTTTKTTTSTSTTAQSQLAAWTRRQSASSSNEKPQSQSTLYLYNYPRRRNNRPSPFATSTTTTTTTTSNWATVVNGEASSTPSSSGSADENKPNGATKNTEAKTGENVNGSSSSSPSEPSPAALFGADEHITQIRLNVNEKARTVTSVCTSGTLCTVSAHEGISGAPFGSYVDYVLDGAGNPVFLMNDMSMHTINIQKASAANADGGGALVTLFVQVGGASGGNGGNGGFGNGSGGASTSQDVSRCSLTGRLQKISGSNVDEIADDLDAIRMRYSIAHAYADQVMDSPKFAFYRLVPEKIYFVGGFGVLAKWIEPDEYHAANPDILATEAASIVRRINQEYVEDLQRTATQLLGVATEIVKVRMTAVDRLGMDIRVTSQMGTRRNKLQTDEFRIGFRIPVISIEDAKSEILKVFQEAWEKEQDLQWDNDEVNPGQTVPILKIAADSLE